MRKVLAGNMDENPQPPAVKKVRGGAKLNFLNKLKKGEKVSLEFCRGAPVGLNANKISAYCGKLALNGENYPFDIPDWSGMPHKEEKLEEAIEELKNIFHYSDEINFWVEEKIHEKWKASKRNMRLEHFDEKKTDAQNRASCPDKTQWANMLIYWRSPEFKKKSENGKASRKCLVVPHHGGIKSFVNHAIEIEETTQKKASRAAVYQKTYRVKEGKTPNPISEANRAQVEALERKNLEENGSDNDVSILELTSHDQLKGDKYSKIMGAEKPGRIRGVGSAIKVTKLIGESSSIVVQNNEENAVLRDEIKKLKEDQVHMQNDMERTS
ncbi:uncharacterized protein LOC113323543 isoform X1 [Papaver somniferum]|uniref:uncharacterized protein LOC113323543 isoform X1 n=1 Tax=Papaver somniferum TaxID=3469 RepID=UPI000E6F5A17|nr:uncharacterized protein LOC113323543 isoform X1 [Papaver somniferum]XP_026427641.1 uncharacterized protein LOC113323543 isoform X1 [Papaver somniferum]